MAEFVLDMGVRDDARWTYECDDARVDEMLEAFRLLGWELSE